jgi:hypothetical protein
MSFLELEDHLDLSFSGWNSGQIRQSFRHLSIVEDRTDEHQALIEAGIQPLFHDIQKNTTGIVFLGTPHRGSGAATLGQIAASIANVATPGLQFFNRKMLRDLEKDNDNLFQTSNRFSNICAHMTIRSFYETVPMYGSRVVS